jgi:hypothetical protein
MPQPSERLQKAVEHFGQLLCTKYPTLAPEDWSQGLQDLAVADHKAAIWRPSTLKIHSGTC